MHVRVRRLDPDLPLPAAQHPDDAGYDLVAREEVALASGGGRALVPTGIAIAIPAHCAGLVLPRSGLALKHGVTCLNTPGLIDPQYRGELKVLLVNTDPTEPYTIRRGDRIAQLVVTNVELVEWIEVDELDTTTRDTFGFGSTGR
jgi:dUTP pyrophosphatase